MSNKKWDEHAVLRHDNLAIRIVGACFQAPCATPGQRPMETLIISHLMFLHMHKTTSKLPKLAGILC